VIITQSTQTLCGHNAHTLCYVSQAVYCSPECQDERTLIRKSENDNSRRKTETCSWKLSVCLSAPSPIKMYTSTVLYLDTASVVQTHVQNVQWMWFIYIYIYIPLVKHSTHRQIPLIIIIIIIIIIRPSN